MKSKTFCLAPWTHGLVHTDLTMRPCCASTTVSDITVDNYIHWWNGADMKQLRSDLHNGIKNPGCDFCWKTEALGHNSLRQNYNNLFNKYVKFSNITDSAKKDFVPMDGPVTWDLRLGNLCNLKCVMCSPAFSDKIQEEIDNNKQIINSIFPNKLTSDTSSISDWTNIDKIDAFFIDIKKSARWIKLQGGEPLAVKSVRSLITELNASQTTLSLTTNGTILDKKLLNALSNLDHIEISISVESADQNNNIIRYGSDWNIIDKNIKLLKLLPNVDIQLNHVLQITSVFYLKNVLQYSEENDLHLAIGLLKSPDYLSLNACPREYLEQMIDDIDSITIIHKKNQYIKPYIKNIIDQTVFDPNKWYDFKNYVKVLDKIRPNKFSSVLKFKGIDI
jgi:sulfatase maturation enzyme AslB (radical SAM superfamily)